MHWLAGFCDYGIDNISLVVLILWSVVSVLLVVVVVVGGSVRFSLLAHLGFPVYWDTVTVAFVVILKFL